MKYVIKRTPKRMPKQIAKQTPKHILSAEIPVLAALVVALLAACTHMGADPIMGEVPQQVDDRFTADPGDIRVETWVEGLEIPWGLTFLDRDTALVTERPGRVRLIERGMLLPEPYLELEVASTGEAGLMGVAAHPEFPNQPYVYVMYTYRGEDGLTNRVERYRHAGRTAELDRLIIDGIPGARFHDGGRIAFGPDGMLYITTGENFRAELAQDLDSLGGKILRLTPEGEIPRDNPFDRSPVFSYGHRNPQGLAWHPRTGALFASEHGPSGEFGLRGHDIVNVIVKGGNYGWPRAVGEVNRAEYADPLLMWVRATPPAGMAFWRGRLYLASLGAETLIRIGLDPRGGGAAGGSGADAFRVTSVERLFAEGYSGGRYGRMRAVVAGPDGALYVSTSNRDGRGDVRAGDDRILRIVPAD